DPRIDQDSLVVQILGDLTELDWSELFGLASDANLEGMDPKRRISIVSGSEMEFGWVLRSSDGILAWIRDAPVVEQAVHYSDVALCTARAFSLTNDSNVVNVIATHFLQSPRNHVASFDIPNPASFHFR